MQVSQKSATFIPENMYPRVHNIVATVELNTRLSLKSLSDRMRNCEYNPKRFSALVVRMKDPKTTALLFASGKMVITGARNLEALEQGVRMHVRAIRKAEHSAIKIERVTVHNIVASCNIDAPLRLEALRLGLGGSDGGVMPRMMMLPPAAARTACCKLAVKAWLLLTV